MFPPHGATRAEVDAWYAARGMARPACEPRAPDEPKAVDHVWHDFCGMNCNEYLEPGRKPCRGWDGKSGRCDCGNRRVYWDTSEDPPIAMAA